MTPAVAIMLRRHGSAELQVLVYVYVPVTVRV